MTNRNGDAAALDALASEDYLFYNEEEMMSESDDRNSASIVNNDDDKATTAIATTQATTRPSLNRRVTPSPEPGARPLDIDTPGPPSVPTSPVESPFAASEAVAQAAGLPPSDLVLDANIQQTMLASVQGMAPSQYVNALGMTMPPAMAAFDETINAVQQVAAAAPSNDDEDDALPTELSEKEARKLLESEEKQDWKRTQKELDDMFEKLAKDKFEGIPDFVFPEGMKSDVTLYTYQKDGIRWLLEQETNEDRIPPFYKERLLGSKNNRWWSCSLTRKMQMVQPKPCLGSILADDMGLGKTLQSIGLILSNPPNVDEEEPRCTLIVAPMSVVANWKIQLQKFVEPGKLEVTIYHGSKRQQVLNQVKRNEVDIMLTTYETLASDLKQHEELLAEQEELKDERKKHKSSKKAKKSDEVRDAWHGSDEDDWEPDDSDDDEDDHQLSKSILRKRKRAPVKNKTWIFDVIFHRIILDEAHKIRNSATGVFKSMTRIASKYKLCLTGTPFVNRPSDIHSLLAFLEAEPLSDKQLFAGMVVQPILEAKEIGLARIRTMMSHLALRRSKALVESTIQLVPKEVVVRLVEFPEGDHGTIHEVLYSTVRAAFIGLLRSGEEQVYNHFMYFLSLVLRVRQSCCSGYLVPEDTRLLAESLHGQIQSGEVDLDAAEGAELLQKLVTAIQGNPEAPAEEYDNECAICCNELEEDTTVVIRSCKHVFCESCLNLVDNNLCPFCREPYNASDLIKKTTAEAASKKKGSSKAKSKKAEVDDDGDEVPPKVQALLDAIGEMQPDEKGVVFSQWTSYLDIVQAALERNGHSTTRIDGSMNAMERINAMEAFSNDDGPRFILCSLHACGTGINLTRGNYVFMMDNWWNSAIENQAMDRVHRIGQQRPVKVIRFIMKESIEERMDKLQESKAALGKGSLQKLTREERKKARITALKDLFQVDEVDIEWEGVYEDEDAVEDPTLGGFIVGDDIED